MWMLRTACKFVLPGLLAAALLTACQHGDDATSSTASSPVPPVPAQAESAPGQAGSSALPGDQASTKRYRVDITYPQLGDAEAALKQTLQANSKRAKQQFMQALPDPQEHPEFADRQMSLIMHYSVAARLPRFVSVRLKGGMATGGAHPIPIEASFVYDTQAGQVISIDDLFADPQLAREDLAAYARKQLLADMQSEKPDADEATPQARKEWVDNMRGMIQHGTEPNAENFANFVVLAGADHHASGLLLIFSPYQVAPYVYGTRTVNVPVEVFGDQLKSTYRDVFGD